MKVLVYLSIVLLACYYAVACVVSFFNRRAFRDDDVYMDPYLKQ